MWLGLTLAMWYAAAGSFATARRVLQGRHREVAEAMELLGTEINRTYFRAYGWAQVALALGLLAVLAAQKPRDVISLTVAGAMFVVVVGLSFYLTPAITELGRQLDFVPREPLPPEMGRFRLLHGLYTGLDAAKFLAGLVLLVRGMMGR
jgi:hypothetical protein